MAAFSVPEPCPRYQAEGTIGAPVGGGSRIGLGQLVERLFRCGAISVVLILALLACASEEDAVRQLRGARRGASHDTVPPMVSNYRAVLLPDGRVAVQLLAGDAGSGISRTGAVTRYSLDGGRTWHRAIHSPVEDDFGRPALFETVLGPFPRGANLLLGLVVRDRAGNVSMQLPADAAVFLAPQNAGLAVDSFGMGKGPSGNPIFSPEAVARRAAWVLAAESAVANLLTRALDGDLSPTERFELRRLEELRTVPAAFTSWGVDVTRFRRVDAALVKVGAAGGSDQIVFRVRPWR